MWSTWVWLAPSISMTSRLLPWLMPRQTGQVLSGLGVGPCAQFSALARIRATVVLPVPRGPAKREAGGVRAGGVRVWCRGPPRCLPLFLPLYMLGARAPDRSAQWGPVEMIGIAIFFGLTMPLVAGLAGLREEALT